MIQFNCPKCRSALTVADDNAGRHTWCRSCQRVVMVPAALAEASTAPAELPATPLHQTGSVKLPDRQGEIEQLRTALENVRTEHSQDTGAKSQQLDALQRDLDSIRAERDAFASDLSDQQTRVKTLEQDLEKALQDRSESKAVIQNLESELASAKFTPPIAPPLEDDRANALENEKEALNAELAKTRDTLSQRDRDLNELRRNAEDTEALREKISTLETAAHERDGLRSQIQTLNETAKNEAAAMAALQERLRDTESNNATLTQQLQEAGEFAQTAAKDQHAGELKELRAHLDAAQNATTSEQSALAELQEKLWNAESENTSLNDRIREFETQIAQLDALKEKAAGLDASQHEISDLRERLEAAKQVGADDQAAMATIQEKLGEAERDAEDLRQRLEAAAQAGSDEQSALADLQEKLRNSESKIAEQAVQIAELTRQTSELDALREQATTLVEVQRDAANLREQLQFANEAGATDRSALTELQEKLQHAESQLAKLKGEIAGLTGQVSELDGLREQAAALEETQRNSENLREQLEAASAAQANTEAHAAELESRIQSLDTERANLAERLDATEKRANTAEESLRQAETDLANRNADSTAQDSLLAETRLDLEKAKEETAALHASLAEQAESETTDTAGLETELQEVRAELERKSDEVNSLSAELESERARANVAEAHAAIPSDEFAETTEPPALQPVESGSHANADDQQTGKEEPQTEEDDMLDALMRFLGRH